MIRIVRCLNLLSNVHIKYLKTFGHIMPRDGRDQLVKPSFSYSYPTFLDKPTKTVYLFRVCWKDKKRLRQLSTTLI